jgi:crossover junction endodeoxyribonuclease RuvC
MIVCGIDPGLTGALAVINEIGDCQILDMPILGEGAETVVNGAMIARFLDEFDVEFAVLEKSQAYPGQGVSSTFKNGLFYGQILGVLQASLIPYRLVSPPVWKKAMKLGKDKDLSRLRATERFPNVCKSFERVKDHGRAEAVLLAVWMLENGDHQLNELRKWRVEYDKRSTDKGSQRT